MFRGLINDAKSAAGSLIAKYLARASVAVPFVIAMGFATAAITLMLVERFGAVVASWLVAGGFTAIGLVATLAITVKEQEEEVAAEQAQEADTAGVATDSAAQAAAQLPLALFSALLSTPLGPGTVAKAAQGLARNIPLVVMLTLIALLFWPSEPAGEESELAEPRVRPDGAAPAAPDGLHQEAAAA